MSARAIKDTDIHDILKTHDRSDRTLVSQAYMEGGTDMLFDRLERAALNQAHGGEARLARYAIWANTVRDHVIEGMRLMDAGDAVGARRMLTLAVNGLSAFSEIQALFDPERTEPL